MLHASGKLPFARHLTCLPFPAIRRAPFQQPCGDTPRAQLYLAILECDSLSRLKSPGALRENASAHLGFLIHKIQTTFAKFAKVLQSAPKYCHGQHTHPVASIAFRQSNSEIYSIVSLNVALLS